MRRIIYFTFVLFTLLSCKKEDNIRVIIYNYGRSEIGTTFDIPVKFIIDDKTEAIFRLYSYDQNLAEGIYQYNDKDIHDCRMWGPYNCTDKTFFKNRCKWGDKYVTDGYVSVEKESEIYTFVVGVQTTDGVWHNDYQYIGKVKRENWKTKSDVGGMFCALDITNAINNPGTPHPLPQGYNGATMLCVATGDIYYGITFFLKYMHPEFDDPTGTYSITGNDIIQKIYTPNVTGFGTSIKLVSGTFTVTRVNKPWKFRVDIDVVDEKGRVIQGCFDGGELCGDYGTYL